MRTFVTRVHLYIEEGGGHLRDIVHKKWNHIKKIWIKVDQLEDTCFIIYCSTCFSNLQG